MLTIRNSDSMVQIGDDFANYRLVRSYTKPVSEFFAESAGSFGIPGTPAQGGINVAGAEAPLIVIRPFNSDHRGSVSVWWGGLPVAPTIYGKQKSMMYQVEVYVFGKTSTASADAGPKLLMRNASGIVEYDSRHIPFVVADFLQIDQTVPVGSNEIDLGVYLPGRGLGVCQVGPRTNFKSTNPQVAYVEVESIRVTTDNHIWLSNIRLWDTNNGAYFAPGDFDMTANPSYLMLVDTDKLPLPYEAA